MYSYCSGSTRISSSVCVHTRPIFTGINEGIATNQFFMFAMGVNVLGIFETNISVVVNLTL